MKTIYFDMDGTLADLYGQLNWLSDLRSSNPSPYKKARPLVNMRVLARQLNILRAQGYKIGIISWLSKDSNTEYSKEVRLAKTRWLSRHLPSVYWDEVHIVKFGTPKHRVARDKQGILFDDNSEIRNKWKGQGFQETLILEKLKELIR